MNSELVEKAAELVGNPNILINIISRRVKQLNSGNRPMVIVSPTMGAADIALTEVIDGKLDWEVIEDKELVESNSPRKSKKKK